MYEIEVKVRTDHKPIRDRLGDLGAESRGAVEQVDTYFDHPDRSFAETDEALRIRRERSLGGSGALDTWDVTLTYKGPLVEQASKTREEIETGIDDGSAAEGLLEALGFDPVATVRKERERFQYGGYVVSLDQVADVGTYVEVETTGSETEIKTRRAGAYDLLRELGCDPERQLRTSYLELLLED